MGNSSDKLKTNALEYFSKDPVFHLDMSEPIQRGSADILFADRDEGVLLRELNSGAYFLSAASEEVGRQMLKLVENAQLVCVHQEFLVWQLKDKFSFNEELQLRQYGYLSKELLEEKGELTIRPVDRKDLELVYENYRVYNVAELEKLREDKQLFGGYLDDQLAGFVGIHQEGGLGLLKVLDQYQRRGFGRQLEAFITNDVIKKGWIPFGQVAKGNLASESLQASMGITPADGWIYWLFA